MVIPKVLMCYAIEASIMLAGLEINSIGTSLNRSSHYQSKSYSVKPNKSKSPNAQCSKPSSLLSSFCYCNLYCLSDSSESILANYFNNSSAYYSASFFFLILISSCFLIYSSLANRSSLNYSSSYSYRLNYLSLFSSSSLTLFILSCSSCFNLSLNTSSSYINLNLYSYCSCIIFSLNSSSS